jgi:hypothetical protein
MESIMEGFQTCTIRRYTARHVAVADGGIARLASGEGLCSVGST